MKKSWIVATAVVTALFGGFVAMAACSQQTEGEVCSTANGNDDCDTDNNLQCYPVAQLNNVIADPDNPSVGRCCPIDRTTATTPQCIIPVAISANDAQAPADTGPPVTSGDASTTDAGTADATDQ